jgi:hypothetical protein
VTDRAAISNSTEPKLTVAQVPKNLPVLLQPDTTPQHTTSHTTPHYTTPHHTHHTLLHQLLPPPPLFRIVSLGRPVLVPGTHMGPRVLSDSSCFCWPVLSFWGARPAEPYSHILQSLTQGSPNLGGGGQFPYLYPPGTGFPFRRLLLLRYAEHNRKWTDTAPSAVCCLLFAVCCVYC